MELLLNLVWLALAVPILAICRRTSRLATAAFRNGRSQGLVLASCFLMLAFPVVSASDDLSVLGTEMEESDSSHLTIKKMTGTVSPWVSSPPLAEIASIVLVRPEPTLSEEVFEFSPVVTCKVRAASRGCRAPPSPQPSMLTASPTVAQRSEVDVLLTLPRSMTGLQTGAAANEGGARGRTKGSRKWAMYRLKGIAGLRQPHRRTGRALV